MTNYKNYISFFVIIMLMTSFTSCGDDDNNEEEEDVFAGCCSDEPVFGENIDNLDQSQGEIIVYNLFTPNNDAINDRFSIENIELYDNHEVTIYTFEDEVIFQSNNYGAGFDDLFPVQNQGQFGVEGLPDGTYKYKIVINNEETFRKSGTLCLFGDFSSLETQNFVGCSIVSEFDPTLTGPLN